MCEDQLTGTEAHSRAAAGEACARLLLAQLIERADEMFLLMVALV